MVKVSNMTNSNGKAVANQFVIEDQNKIIFQSYDKIVCIIYSEINKIAFYNGWNYSKTTIKYLIQFLHYMLYDDFNIEKIEKMIEEKIYINSYQDQFVVKFEN